MVARPPLRSKSLNWDVQPPKGPTVHAPTLNPREVLQVAFLVERGQFAGDEEGDEEEEEDTAMADDLVDRDGRMTLGQLSFVWRTAMGERGGLSTGWLTFRKR